MNDLSRAFTNYIIVNKLESTKVLEKTGISQVAISNISSGRYNLRFSVFKKFANSEGISPFELLSYAYKDKDLKDSVRKIHERINKRKKS
jgi:transcriptional regulator with XRE-family HTH domain